MHLTVSFNPLLTLFLLLQLLLFSNVSPSFLFHSILFLFHLSHV